MIVLLQPGLLPLRKFHFLQPKLEITYNGSVRDCLDHLRKWCISWTNNYSIYFLKHRFDSWNSFNLNYFQNTKEREATGKASGIPLDLTDPSGWQVAFQMPSLVTTSASNSRSLSPCFATWFLQEAFSIFRGVRRLWTPSSRALLTASS